jgi:hypothetical protein
MVPAQGGSSERPLVSSSTVSRRGEFTLGLLFVVAWAALGAGCGGGGGGTTKAQPISESNLVGARPDSPAVYEHPNAAADAFTIVKPLGGNRYSLEVTNTNSKGFINKFTWFPAAGTKIVAVTGTRLQHAKGPASCALVGGKISCRLSLPPPTCTCRGDGGSVTIAFETGSKPTAGGSTPTFGGDLFIAAETLVPYFVPSSPDQKRSDLADVPICAAGQASTEASPCLASR